MVNWKAFETKYDKKEQWAFENMAYFLFCAEMNSHIGLFRYKNQAGIETEPIENNGKVYGFQAKYYSTFPNKNNIIDSIQKAKEKNPQLNVILLYVNKELSEGKSKKKPNYQVDIEQAAAQVGVEIEWRVPSHLEFQLSQPKNKWILDIFFGENGLTPDFFSSQVEKQITNLGPRFNEKLNFRLPIVQLFDNIAHNENFHERLIKTIDKWLTEKSYRRLTNNEHLSEIEKELDSLKKELTEWTAKFDYSIINPIELSSFLDKLDKFSKKVADKKDELWKQKDYKESPKKFEEELYRLREIKNVNDDFIDEIEELKINLTNNPTLIIQGEAGCGKSHLLGDIATQRIKQALPTILLLGTSFNNHNTIENNILNQLGLTCKFDDFLANLNSIGNLINSRVLILIDAINEGAGADLWKNQIAGFISHIAKYPAIGLVLTIRSTYFEDIIKTDDKITIVEHVGFKGSEYEALKLFCEYHGLKLPNFPILNPEYSNPLFLHLICEAVKKLPDKSFPKGFNGINKTYNLYKDTLNRKFEEKRPEYKNRNIVSCAIEKMANALFNTEYGQLECKDAVSLFDKEFSQFPYLLSDLIEECVFIKMRYEYSETPKDLIFFSYQKLGDFFMADELLKPYKKADELKHVFESNPTFKKITEKYQWQYQGVIETLSVLLPERYNAEITDFTKFFLKKDGGAHNNYTMYQFTKYLIDSLKWRDINFINDEKITDWLEKHCCDNKYIYQDYFYALIELTAIQNHPFNSNRLHRILFKCTMPERDSFWQKFLLDYNGYDDNRMAFPLRRLIDWAWSDNISNNTDSETARLVAQTLAWVLASTDIALRDQTTKALVNLLEQQPKVLITTLTAFEKVGDLYILERLYAVAYGCILRTEKKESIKIIAQYIYDTIFKNGNPPTHILLRDYARNAVEYAIYKNVGLDIDVNLIRPPYNTKMPDLPTTEDDVKQYQLDYDSPDFKQTYGSEHNAIYDSLFADFGRYVVESNIRKFQGWDYESIDEKNHNNNTPALVEYWIIKRVFELGYNRELHGEYDSRIRFFHGYDRHNNKIERIGKKYQWIALYEILAILADNYPITDGSYPAKYDKYQGTWQLGVRNIDPAYITKNKDEDEENGTIKSTKEWWKDEEYTQWNFPDAEWVKTMKDLIPPKSIIQKQDTQENEWLRLQHYVTWKEPKKIGKVRHEYRWKEIWYIIQGLLVKKSDKQKIINYLNHQNFYGRWLPENQDEYSGLINREKFWSPAYLDIYKNNKHNWETIQDTQYEVIVATEKSSGYVHESDKSGASQSYNIPCKFIFEGMELQYAPTDGDLRNAHNEVIVTNNNSKSILIRKKDLIQFLDDNKLDIIWTLLGEKYSCGSSHKEQSFFKVLCGVYDLEEGEIHEEMKMYDYQKNFVSLQNELEKSDNDPKIN